MATSTRQQRSAQDDLLAAHGGTPPYKAVNPKYPGGLSNYLWDSYGLYRNRTQSLQGTAGPAGAYADILRTFSGSQDHLQKFLAAAGPFFAAQVAQTPEWQQAQNYEGRANVLDFFQTAAKRLEQSGVSAQRQGSLALQRSGLGTQGAAMAGMRSQIQSQLAGQRSNLYAGLAQEQQQRRRGYAQQSLDNQMQLSSLILGMNPQPRTSDGGGGLTSLVGGIASTAMGGAMLGTAIAPGIGTVIGGVAGGITGAGLGAAGA